MRIVLNGEDREVGDGVTVTELLRELGLEGVLVAVERNEEIVPRATHPTTVLHDGDAVEVVHFVGGG
ncbi:MAG: sulfur carrier protein ThiS [Sandaracinus sp.]|nr:sulfur carrier protein ThiS [Myxococcales bacterium]MCB9599491.1 sulfur carrier protein ThiS [Sandaracinus sp.]MCB9611408.1 sulfur carrier protein ThiS [Sandaracinus sp.]MCB9621753.1 sulfur carrier protein ThiS [Sandaracinus sp.]MCB9632252.1 sulfur carrier protein ThiS [Sandaracinus sp.]